MICEIPKRIIRAVVVVLVPTARPIAVAIVAVVVGIAIAVVGSHRTPRRIRWMLTIVVRAVARAAGVGVAAGNRNGPGFGVVKPLHVVLHQVDIEVGRAAERCGDLEGEGIRPARCHVGYLTSTGGGFGVGEQPGKLIGPLELAESPVQLDQSADGSLGGPGVGTSGL